jgi:ABC-type antimicrobial peptide transport system permease subunit
MPRNYNHIYQLLVKNDNDLVGIIAYSIYKKQKIQHIEEFKELHKKAPTDDDLVPFNNISSNKTSIEGYRIKAENILEEFLNIILEKHKEDVNRYYKDNNIQILESVIDKLVPKSKFKRFLTGVYQSAVGSILFVFIIAAFIMIVTAANKAKAASAFRGLEVYNLTPPKLRFDG